MTCCLMCTVNSLQSKGELHSLHHMLPLRSCSSQMALRPRGYSYDVPRVVYDLTKHSFILQFLYKCVIVVFCCSPHLYKIGANK